MRRVHKRCVRGFLAAAMLIGAASSLRAEQPMSATDPGTLEEAPAGPLCCGVPPGDEVTADQVFGRWVVSKVGVGAPMRAGERVEFRPDGTMTTARGACRFAILRAELTVTCAEKSESGEVSFIDDTKLIWRHKGREVILVAPAD